MRSLVAPTHGTHVSTCTSFARTTSKRSWLTGFLVIGLWLVGWVPQQAVNAQTCTPAPVGLVSWWSADGNALDSRGRANGALINGATFAAGQNGQAFSFDGNNDSIDTHLALDTNLNFGANNFTIEAWVNLPIISPGTFRMIYANGYNNNSIVFLAIEAGNRAQFFIRDGSGLPLSVIGTTTLNDGVWHHVAGVRDGTTARLYVDGTQQGVDVSDPAFGTIFSACNFAFIGGFNSVTCSFPADGSFFNGLIDEVSVYNRALSATEVAAIHAASSAGKCKPTATVAPTGQVAWLAGDGNANDIAGTNNGTLQNGAGFAVSRVGQGFSFNGSVDFVSIANNGSLDFGAGNFSIEFWANLNDLSTDQTLFHKVSGTGGASTDPQYFVEFNPPNGLRFRVQSNLANSNDLIIPTSLIAGQWFHVTAVRNGNTNQLFLNGVSIGSLTAGSSLNTGTGGNTVIGKCLNAGCDRFVDGRIDEVSLYNRDLTQAEITSIFNAGLAGKLKTGLTGTGSNVASNVGSDATIIFPNVSAEGTTQQIPLDPAVLPALPAGFTGTGLFYDIATSASFTGNGTVCFNLPSFNSEPTFSQLKVLHLESGAWVDRSSGQNFTSRTLCGQVSSFSPFAIAGGATPTSAGAGISGQVTTADGTPLGGVLVTLSGTQTRKTITDASGNYRFANVETSGFYTVTPWRANYSFGPASRSFSQLGNTTEAVFTGTPNVLVVGNAIDTSEYFVRQHYLDFLGREPDEAGFNFWSDQMLECGADAGCLERRRINVSAAYFLSIEFQQTGGLVDGLYKASYGVRPQFGEFMPDTRTIAQNVVVGRSGWEQQLFLNKQAFVDAFVQRAEFRAAFDSLSNENYVARLIAHTGVAFTESERDALVSDLAGSRLTRAGVLLRIAGDSRFVTAKRNEAFVMMQYFGYLRRDPDESGYQFWLNKLNQFGGNFEQAEMVKAFIVSGEYRDRFSR